MLKKHRILGLLLLSNGAIAAQQIQFDVIFEQQSLEQALNLFSRTVEQTILCIIQILIRSNNKFVYQFF